jgi:hypothetical protein
MVGVSPELRQLAVQIVARNQPCSFNTVVNGLRQYGLDTATANRTVLTLIRDGQIARTFTGQLRLPGPAGRTAPGGSGEAWRTVVVAVFVVLFLVLAGWVGFHIWDAAQDQPPMPRRR